MKILVFLIIAIAFSQRAGLPRVSTYLYTRGRNNKHQAGVSAGVSDLDEEKVFLTNTFNSAFVTTWGRKYKLMCSFEENFLVVMSDNTIGIVGNHEYILTSNVDSGDFIAVPIPYTLVNPNFVDLQCGVHTAIFQTDDGKLWGFGSNQNFIINNNPATNNYLILTEMEEGLLLGKTVRTFGLTSSWDNNAGIAVVLDDGSIYWKGHYTCGCCSGYESSPVWARCEASYFNNTYTGADLNITRIAGNDKGLFFITSGGDVYFAGDQTYAGNGAGSIPTREQVVLLDYTSIMIGSETSDLDGKKVRDIACSRTQGSACIAISHDGLMYSWNEGTADMLLARTETSSDARMVPKQVDLTATGASGEDVCVSPNYVAHISAHYDAFCFVCSYPDYRLWCWGDNNHFSITQQGGDIDYPVETGIIDLDVQWGARYYKWTASGYGRTLYYFKAASGVVYVNVLLLLAVFFALF